MANLVNYNKNCKSSFNGRKNNTLCSLLQVENFLNILTACCDTVKLYNICKKFNKYK